MKPSSVTTVGIETHKAASSYHEPRHHYRLALSCLGYPPPRRSFSRRAQCSIGTRRRDLSREASSRLSTFVDFLRLDTSHLGCELGRTTGRSSEIGCISIIDSHQFVVHVHVGSIHPAAATFTGRKGLILLYRRLHNNLSALDATSLHPSCRRPHPSSTTRMYAKAHHRRPRQLAMALRNGTTYSRRRKYNRRSSSGTPHRVEIILWHALAASGEQSEIGGLRHAVSSLLNERTARRGRSPSLSAGCDEIMGELTKSSSPPSFFEEVGCPRRFGSSLLSDHRGYGKQDQACFRLVLRPT